MTASLLVSTPTTKPHAFPDATCSGPCGRLVPPLPTPILQEKRDLVTGPMQPNDVQRIIAHVAFTRCGERHTFRLPTKLRLHPLTWDSLDSPFSILLPARGRNPSSSLSSSAITCKARRPDARIDERAESLTVRRNRRLLQTSSPCSLNFPGTFHSMDAVRKHTLPIGSKEGQTPSQFRLSHELRRKPTAAIGESTFTKVLRAEAFNTVFPHN